MLTMQDIHEAIERVSDEQEELVTEVMTAGDDAATCEATFKAQFAKARLRVRDEAGSRRITVDEVTDRATVETESARLGYLTATNRLTVLREALRAKQSRLDSLRTLAASHRAAGAG